MCDLMTFAVPESCADRVPEAESFSVAPYVSEGGGHRYSEGMRVFALLRGDCSCGVLSKQFRAAVADFLVRTVAQCGSVEILVHRHSGEFAREDFTAKQTITLGTADLVANPTRLARDVRYVIQDEPSNKPLQPTRATSAFRRRETARCGPRG